MEQLKLKATKRTVLGKKNRFLRRQGQTPTHLFGHSIESQALQCDAIALKKIVDHAGTTRLVSLSVEGDKGARNVFVREIQRDVLTKQLPLPKTGLVTITVYTVVNFVVVFSFFYFGAKVNLYRSINNEKVG